MTDTLTIVIGQLNPTVGDVRGNCDKILAAIAQARNELKADIIAFPELMLTGYPPEDLLFNPGFHQKYWDEMLVTVHDPSRAEVNEKKLQGVQFRSPSARYEIPRGLRLLCMSPIALR